ncbi:Hypothetical protein R9X50_00142400 [Acrodontium crateriforme]|uniref:BTB domain-containing protein n=1 Tax=Acrodontium crateriforme TaxID=150365 RepID=A0AAQ3LZ08_9PEZI|nr:Hypothetical protein R9X50_00142400 [Acrodontium crateriforme]
MDSMQISLGSSNMNEKSRPILSDEYCILLSSDNISFVARKDDLYTQSVVFDKFLTSRPAESFPNNQVVIQVPYDAVATQNLVRFTHLGYYSSWGGESLEPMEQDEYGSDSESEAQESDSDESEGEEIDCDGSGAAGTGSKLSHFIATDFNDEDVDMAESDYGDDSDNDSDYKEDDKDEERPVQSESHPTTTAPMEQPVAQRSKPLIQGAAIRHIDMYNVGLKLEMSNLQAYALKNFKQHTEKCTETDGFVNVILEVYSMHLPEDDPLRSEALALCIQYEATHEDQKLLQSSDKTMEELQEFLRDPLGRALFQHHADQAVPDEVERLKQLLQNTTIAATSDVNV